MSSAEGVPACPYRVNNGSCRAAAWARQKVLETGLLENKASKPWNAPSTISSSVGGVEDYGRLVLRREAIFD
ncbi:hypothetical protein IWX64_000205 [Arthrobacter sp. CAN_A212]